MKFKSGVVLFFVIILCLSLVGFAAAINGEKFYGYVDKSYSGTVKIKIPARGDVTLAQAQVEEFFETDKTQGKYGFRDLLIIPNCDSYGSDELACAYEGERLLFYLNNQFVGATIFKNNTETRVDLNYSIIPGAKIITEDVVYVGDAVRISVELNGGIRPYYISSFECYGDELYKTQGIFGDSKSAASLTERPELICKYQKEGDYFIYIKGFDEEHNEFYANKPIKVIKKEMQGVQGSCIPKWDCTDFSACTINQNKERKCLDLEQCNDDATRPLEKVFCKYNIECVPNWKCSDWTECVDGEKTRSCTDLNLCNKEKPEIEKVCGVNVNSVMSLGEPIVEREKASPISWIMALLLVLVGSTAAYHNTKRAVERRTRTKQQA